MERVGVGDRVMALDGTHEGRLVDVDGETGFVLQPNGVEVAFPVARLTRWAPRAVPAERMAAGAPPEERGLSAAEAALMRSVPPALMALVERSYEAGGGGRAWASLPPLKRLEALRVHLPTLPAAVLQPHMAVVMRVRALKRTKGA